MPQTKISGKFYPLQHEELIELNKCLTASELSVYLWLKTNDPFGERLVEADTKVIAEELNISRRSVQRALAKLQKEKLIDVVITKFFYRVRTKPTEESDDTDKIKEKLRVTTSVSPDDISVANETRMSSSVRQCREQYEDVANSTPMSSSKAEITSEQDVQNPQTLQTYLDFKKTLSEDERENFLNFVRETIHNLEKPINDLEAWLASKNAANQNRWEVYYKNYQEQKDRQKSRNTRQNSGKDNLNPDKKMAIAEFRKRMKLDREINEPEPEKFNSNEPELEIELEEPNSAAYPLKKAEFDELLANPPERQEKSLAQLRREQIAEARRQRQELNQKIKEAAEIRARQIEPNSEQHKVEMLRQIAEFQQRQQQNSETAPENPEIEVEERENE